SSGTVEVLGEKMPQLAMMSKIGYMAQGDALYTVMTAKENLEFFGELYGLRGRVLSERIEKCLSLVDLADKKDMAAEKYSGGMKRRLSLAAALLHEPEILILDEPTVGIDPLLRQKIWKQLKRISEQGTTIILTTHVMDEAEKCDRLAMLRGGRLLAVDTPEKLEEITDSASIEEAFIKYGGDDADD
ncbi:MAG: ABC transporter ATP-binding protein, partial [Anaerovoracaceae bacterium]